MNLILEQIVPSPTKPDGAVLESQLARIASALFGKAVAALCVSDAASADNLAWHYFQKSDGTQFGIAFQESEVRRGSIGLMVQQHLRLARALRDLTTSPCYAIEKGDLQNGTSIKSYRILPYLNSIDSPIAGQLSLYLRGNLPEISSEVAQSLTLIADAPVRGWAVQFATGALVSLMNGCGEYIFTRDQVKILLCDIDQTFELKSVSGTDRKQSKFIIGDRVDMEKAEQSLAVTISLGEIAIPASAVAEVRPGASIVITRPAVLEAVLKVGERAWAEAEVEIGEKDITLRVKNLVAM